MFALLSLCKTNKKPLPEKPKLLDFHGIAQFKRLLPPKAREPMCSLLWCHPYHHVICQSNFASFVPHSEPRRNPSSGRGPMRLSLCLMPCSRLKMLCRPRRRAPTVQAVTRILLLLALLHTAFFLAAPRACTRHVVYHMLPT